MVSHERAIIAKTLQEGSDPESLTYLQKKFPNRLSATKKLRILPDNVRLARHTSVNSTGVASQGFAEAYNRPNPLLDSSPGANHDSNVAED